MPQEKVKPEDLARQVALSVASEPGEVGDFLGQNKLENSLSEFRFSSNIVGYEGWLWLVTLYHDVEQGRWTVDESSLIPGENVLLPPKWIPWKDRLLPTDLSVTDAMGTEEDDPRLEPGLGSSEQDSDDLEATKQQDGAIFKLSEQNNSDTDNSTSEQPAGEKTETSISDEAAQQWSRTSMVDFEETVDKYALSRRRVLSTLGQDEAAKRWYEGQQGPKSLSTSTAAGNTCETCGFLVPLRGRLGTMFGVCANRWSHDDGRVVSLNHGCGEHSDIEPPETSHLWVQSKPAFDDLHVDVVHQKAQADISRLELIEEISDKEEEETVRTQEDMRIRQRKRSNTTGR